MCTLKHTSVWEELFFVNIEGAYQEVEFVGLGENPYSSLQNLDLKP